MKSGIRIEALDTLPAEVRRTILHAIAEAAAYGVALRIATPSPARSEAARLAGQASARARAERFGSPNPRANTGPERERPVHDGPPDLGTEREPNVNDLGTERERKRERIVNGSFTSSLVSPPSHTLPSLLISDLRSEDQRESAREARPERRSKAPKAIAWRRVPDGWQPSDQHRQIATECCVPFELELAKFRDHEFSTPKRDPDAAFRNWIRNARRPAPQSAAPFPTKTVTNGHHATRAEIDRMLGLT